MREWWAVFAVLAMAQTVWAEPVRVAKVRLPLERHASHAGEFKHPFALEAATDVTRPGEPVTIHVSDETLLTQTVKEGMMEFIQQNYPSHLRMAMRNMKNDESQLRRELRGSVDFLKEYAGGPITIEGAFKQVRGALRWVVTGTIVGVNGHPDAVLRFETSPGFMRPITEVTVDENGDGLDDEKSSSFCRLDRMREWVDERFPQS